MSMPPREASEGHEFDPDLVRGAYDLWVFEAERMSTLDRQKIEGDAAELTSALLNAAHSASGWCGDIVSGNFEAAWPLVCVALLRLHQQKQRQK